MHFLARLGKEIHLLELTRSSQLHFRRVDELPDARVAFLGIATVTRMCDLDNLQSVEHPRGAGGAVLLVDANEDLVQVA